MSYLDGIRQIVRPGRQELGMRERSVQCIGPHGLHRMVYTEWGEPDNPKVLICVHGLTRNGRDFDYMARSLSDEYRVVCPDVVGRGGSDWLGVKSDYDLPLYVSDMVALIARLNVDSVSWFGTSMGGLIGMVLANLPHTPVSRLILNDVGPDISGVALRRIGSYAGRSTRFTNMQEAEAWVRETCEPFGNLSDEQWQHLARYSVRPTEEGFIATYDPGIGDAFRNAPVIGDIDMWESYNDIRCPVLVVRGAESDLLEPETVRKMIKVGADVRAVEIPGVGHAPVFMDEGQVKLVRDFLKAE